MPDLTNTLNPYAPYLKQEDPLAIIHTTSERLEEMIRKATEQQLYRKPAPEKWSVRDILCHLADTEIAFAYRLRQTVAESHHVIQPYNQDAFAAEYANRSSREALDAFWHFAAGILRLFARWCRARCPSL
ncbi:MAG: DinB family protein [Acidobacteriota bacterium]|nr:DinB family protein [Acidobacteriota bacterium]